MNPKEKAIELVNKFYQTTPNESWINQPIGLKKEYKAWEQSKQCVLIAVTEIINSNPHSNPFNTDIHSTMQYWIEVKKELSIL